MWVAGGCRVTGVVAREGVGADRLGPCAEPFGQLLASLEGAYYLLNKSFPKQDAVGIQLQSFGVRRRL